MYKQVSKASKPKTVGYLSPVATVEHNGKEYQVIVYGEVTTTNNLIGLAPVTFARRSREIVSVGEPCLIDSNCSFHSPLKVFNMGYAICHPEDKYDEKKGIRVAKKHFSERTMTTQNGRFLTKDMVDAIIKNELNYIVNHIDRYIVENK